MQIRNFAGIDYPALLSAWLVLAFAFSVTFAWN